MALNVNELQSRVSSMVNQSVTPPTQGSDEWNLFLKFLNRAQDEFSELYDWQALFKEYSTLTSTSTGNTSIAMPADFRKLASFPRITTDGDSRDYAEIRPQERGNKISSDKFIYFLGNPNSSYTMVVHSGSSNGQLSSGASIVVPYYSSLQSLASALDVTGVPDANYLVQRTVSLIWEAREDGRFPEAKAEAEKILQRMLERENVHSEASTASRVRTSEELSGFRIGRD